MKIAVLFAVAVMIALSTIGLTASVAALAQRSAPAPVAPVVPAPGKASVTLTCVTDGMGMQVRVNDGVMVYP